LLVQAHVAGIFAISRLALTQYLKAGVPPNKLFPFGYFVPFDSIATGLNIPRSVAENAELRIVFVGSLIRRKGIDLLQEAVQQLHAQGCRVTVDIYGPGDVNVLASKGASIHYRGIIPFGQAQKVMVKYDLLVLPSRFDGWGVVVNEALCAGVPVVCSDTTGAGGVATSLGAGLSFSSGDSRSLREVLARLLREPALLKSMQAAAAQAARDLQPAVAARYMLDLIRAPAELRAAIRSPWYTDCA
jgi:glycosyltransferase involved in cell wall biosynthesis